MRIPDVTAGLRQFPDNLTAGGNGIFGIPPSQHQVRFAILPHEILCRQGHALRAAEKTKITTVQCRRRGDFNFHRARSAARR